MNIIDADGHVIEDESLLDYVDEPYRSGKTKGGIIGPIRNVLGNVFPSLDFHHLATFKRSERAFGGGKRVGPEQWLQFLDVAKFEYAFLYPTIGLAMGNISYPDWACAVARAYNNWIHDRYMKLSPRLKGMALLPMQDVSEAVVELRRAVKELGMPGAMLPSRGLPFDLGHRTYWPVYAEAEKLGCALAVHGGCHHGMGLDTFETFVPIHGMGHPLSLLIAFSGMVYHGVFDEFPRLRVGFLEGGAAWVTFWMDRMDRSHHYFGVFVGCEGGEEGLDYQVRRVGNGHLLFASDFPHEIGPEDIMHEIEEVREYRGLTEEDKAAILGGNARRFYQVPAGL
ncbi:MAG: amidohydrolase [Deltaproteobacteria bacterium]|nr:amidohydrolase [Deltaproteobacteria bacterium]